MTVPTPGQPFRLLYLLQSDSVRPRLAESEACGGFLGSEFVWSFDNRAQWITQDVGVFPVGVVDAPQLVGRLLRRARTHDGSSAQAADG